MNIDYEPTKKALEAALPFLNKLVSPPIEELGLLFQDKLREWRFNRQIEMLARVQEKIKKNNIKIKQISVKILAPLLDGASLEEDFNLQEMWANLMVNYVDRNKNLKSSVFPYILGQLSSNEANILSQKISNNNERSWDSSISEDSEKLEEYEIFNLIRLGLLQIDYDYPNNNSWDNISVKYNTSYPSSMEGLSSKIKITPLAKEFIKACTEPQKG